MEKRHVRVILRLGRSFSDAKAPQNYPGESRGSRGQTRFQETRFQETRNDKSLASSAMGSFVASAAETKMYLNGFTLTLNLGRKFGFGRQGFRSVEEFG